MLLGAPRRRRPGSCVQQQTPIRPRQTRFISSAARRWSGANMCPKVETTRSKLPSSNGSSCTFATTQSTSTIASAARSLASASMSASRSTPVTRAPARAAGMHPLPEPQATSSSSMPGSTPTRSSSSSATASISCA